MPKLKFCYLTLSILFIAFLKERIETVNCSPEQIKEPNVSGQFYPQDKDTLSQKIDSLINQAAPQEVKGDIFCLISPHAGYDFSGQTAAFGYKLIKGHPYKTVVIIGPSHYYGFRGISVYPQGEFSTPLGNLEIDSEFAQKIIGFKQNIAFDPKAFAKEHSVEVQLPFLQKAFKDFRIVPVVIGQCDFKDLNNLADSLVKAIGRRKDILLVASTDLMHSYDYDQTEMVDRLTLSHLEKMSPEDIYEKLTDGTIQMCGGPAVVAAMITAKKLGHDKLKILDYTNSALVSGKKLKGLWTVGYASAVIDQEKKGEEIMLNTNQKNRLLEIARKSILEYVTDNKRLDLNEDDPQLRAVGSAFVTLHKQGKLRGCIGNIVGQKPLFETVRDMAIEAAAADPRFPALLKEELKDIEIEISVLSPLKKIASIDEFQLGIHGVLIRKGWNQGVFLPQVATETGWSKEEFLSFLCEHKAGLPADCWKDPETEIFIFSALVFSEKQLQ